MLALSEAVLRPEEADAATCLLSFGEKPLGDLGEPRRLAQRRARYHPRRPGVDVADTGVVAVVRIGRLGEPVQKARLEDLERGGIPARPSYLREYPFMENHS